jgi:hypothetical protein
MLIPNTILEGLLLLLPMGLAAQTGNLRLWEAKVSAGVGPNDSGAPPC